MSVVRTKLTMLQQICQRRSVTQFQPTLPEDFDKSILASMNAARHAPNHKRTEPWKFYLLGKRAQGKIKDIVFDLEMKKTDSKEKALTKLAMWDKVPQIMALTSARSADTILDMEDYAATCCAAQNFMLSLSADGYGTKWITGGVAVHSGTPVAVGFEPTTERLVGLFWVGLPARPFEVPHKRKSAHDILIRVP